MNQLFVVLLSIAVVLLGFLAWRFLRQARSLQERFAGIINVEANLTSARNKLEQIKQTQQQIESENAHRRAQLQKEYEQALGTYKELKKEISYLFSGFSDAGMRSTGTRSETKDY